jgi:hypothetical protein
MGRHRNGRYDEVEVPTPQTFSAKMKSLLILLMLISVASGCSFGRDKVAAVEEERTAHDSAYETGSPVEHE